LTTAVRRAERSLARLIDAYQDGLIEKREFESRTNQIRERIAQLQQEAQALQERDQQVQQMKWLIGNLQDFASRVQDGLEQITDPYRRREIVRALVKRVEVGSENLRIVYRVGPVPFDPRPDQGILQHRCRLEQVETPACAAGGGCAHDRWAAPRAAKRNGRTRSILS